MSWITGASSGIGRELALRFAAMGCNVAASSRSLDKLQEMALSDPRIKPYPVGCGNAGAAADVFARIEADLGPVDLAVLNAGIWEQMVVSDFSGRARQAVDVGHYFGVLHTLEPP